MAIGRIRTSFGVRGEVKVTSYSGEYEHFALLKSVSVRKGVYERTVQVESTRWSGDVFLLKFVGIDALEPAKALADHELWAPRTQAAPLKDGEVYFSDLVGCSLVFEGEPKGTITGFWDGNAVELLEVKTNDGRQVLVPFQDHYLGDIDLPGRTVSLRFEWILE